MLEQGEHFDRFIVDARDLKHISPVGLAVLASILRYAVQTERFEEGALLMPQKKWVRTYLARMNFERLIKLQGRPERLKRGPRRGRFKELVEVIEADKCMDITQQICTVLKKQMELGDTILNNVKYCLCEVLENVCFHAESPIHGVACAQTYPKSGAVELAIADCGIGIRRSLSKNPEYPDRMQSDADAIHLAVKRGVTSTPGRTSGEGLFFVSELAKSTGKMLLYSETAAAVFTGTGITMTEAHRWPGTLVGLRLERKRAIPIRELFDRYVPVGEDGEFILNVEQLVTHGN